jgi:SpoVK/Ycf46/Vps4 family AAA+-type ATPase
VFRDLEASSIAPDPSATAMAAGASLGDIEMQDQSNNTVEETRADIPMRSEDVEGITILEERQAAARVGSSRTGMRTGLKARGPLTFEELQHVAINGTDFELALLKVQPSVRREGFSTKPDVTWADVVRSPVPPVTTRHLDEY